MTYHTVPELALRYQVQEQTVRAWIKNRELETLNCGVTDHKKKPRYRITPEALAAFEKKRTIGGAKPKPRIKRKRAPSTVVQYV